MKKFFLCAVVVMTSCLAQAQVTLRAAEGWLETCWVEWHNGAAYTDYRVYVAPGDADDWTPLDKELVRNYGSYGRADALGLKAGTYRLKVVPVADATELTAEAAVTESLVVKAHDRTGYAHMGRPTGGWLEGVGAYKLDGTLKDDAIVLYVSAKTAKTLTVSWPYTSTSVKTYTGLYRVVEGYRKCLFQGGLDKPLCIRIVGTITADDMDYLRFGQGLDVKGEQPYSELPFTLEGVGNDATFYGFGIQLSQVTGVELRNLGIILCKDDGIELNKNNSHCWLHNIDCFYGQVGSDADQVKGDGSMDIKYSQHITVSYNHYFDNGKCCLIDPSKSYGTETPADCLTYHHNWYDHADSRLPRCRHGKMFHVYNNYYDGNGSYGIGLASNAVCFAEGNYFRNCKYPVINSGQGTDKDLVDAKLSQKGLLSGEDGGMIKFWNNHVEGAKSFYDQHNCGKNSFDAYVVQSRDEQIPATVHALKAVLVTTPTTYSNFDTNAETFYACTPDAPEAVPGLVTGQYGAGRCQQGDFRWTFDNATEDDNTDVIPALKSALVQYRSSLVGYYPVAPAALRGVSGDAMPSASRVTNLLGQPVAPNTPGILVVDGKLVTSVEKNR